MLQLLLKYYLFHLDALSQLSYNTNPSSISPSDAHVTLPHMDVHKETLIA
jgi:hypothetical protein